MKVNIYSPRYSYNYVQNNKRLNRPHFNGKVSLNKKTSHRALTFVTAVLIMLGGFSSCFSSSRITGKDNSKGFKFEYYNVDRHNRDEIRSAYFDFKSKLNKDNNFLDGVKLILTDKNAHLEDDYSFKTFLKNCNQLANAGGVSYYSDKNVQSIIAIQEYPHTVRDDIYAIVLGNRASAQFLKHSLFHEIGHQFDEYFGHDHSEKFARDFDSLMYIREQDPNDSPYLYGCKSNVERNIIEQYTQKNTLSDRDEFKEAITKDFNQVAAMLKTTPGYLPDNIVYYTEGLDMSKEITAEDIENADIARGEVFANLFSYALGQNDGDKALFKNAFSSTYPIVVSYIKEFLGEDFIKQSE